jgi:hypothetical protein
MKTRIATVSLSGRVAVCFADDVNMGTWKLNEAKSKLSPGAPKATLSFMRLQVTT